MTDHPDCNTCAYKLAIEKQRAEEAEIASAVKNYIDALHQKFCLEHPCPKCGSHNVDIDWGCPIRCEDCGHEWV